MRLAHRVEEIGVLRRFHCDLRVERHVIGQVSQPLHQLEPFAADSLELVERRRIRPPPGHGEVVHCHRIKVVIRQHDELEPAAAQVADLVDDVLGASHTRLLPVRAPDGAERAVFRTPAHGLHRGEHVCVLRQQIPPAAVERSTRDLPAFIEVTRLLGRAVSDHRAPHVIAVATHDGMGGAVLAGLVGVERRMNAAEDDICTLLPHGPAELVAPVRIGRVDPDAHDIPWRDRRQVQLFERLVDYRRRAVFGGRRRRQGRTASVA